MVFDLLYCRVFRELRDYGQNMVFFSHPRLFSHLSPLRLLIKSTLTGWAGRDHTGRLTRPETPPIMPPRRDNELPIFTHEGIRPANSNAGDQPPRSRFIQ